MNTSQLKKWKKRKTEEESLHVENAIKNGAYQVKDVYNDFGLQGSYTTSLDPYIPVWALIPFFDQIIVGVLPYLKTEEDFKNWYGVSVKQLLMLEDQNRVKIRLIFPRSINTVPNYLNSFFEKNYPSSLRDYEFNRHILGDENSRELRNRFSFFINRYESDLSIDTFRGNRKRAVKTAETVYLQLAALGYTDQIDHFEKLSTINIDDAVKWLEICRLFFVGPEHYSLGGIHAIADNSINEIENNKKTIIFPSDVGVVLVKAFELYKPKYEITRFSLEDCISVYKNSELARSTLVGLAEYVKNNNIDIDTIEKLKDLIRKTRKRDEFWMRTLRLVAATAVSASMMPFEPVLGVLAGLGFSIISESKAKPIDRTLKPMVEKIKKSRLDPSLALLLRLDEDVRKNYATSI